jgi:predicted Na+-dependent transporter
MARGNTALSISMTGVSSLLAIVTTPLNIHVLGRDSIPTPTRCCGR